MSQEIIDGITEMVQGDEPLGSIAGVNDGQRNGVRKHIVGLLENMKTQGIPPGTWENIARDFEVAKEYYAKFPGLVNDESRGVDLLEQYEGIADRILGHKGYPGVDLKKRLEGIEKKIETIKGKTDIDSSKIVQEIGAGLISI